MLRTPLGRLRLVGLIEGASFLILLGIAMPLKAFAGLPLAVTYVGWAHGVLFMLYAAAIVHVWLAERWPFTRAALAGVASVVPGGPFLMDPSLRREQLAKGQLPAERPLEA